MNAWLRIPKVQMALALILIFLSVFLYKPSLNVLIYFLFAAGITVFFDVLFIKLRRVNLFPPIAALVSGLIIGLVNSPNASWYNVVIISFLAMASKNFIRFQDRHIFNPAGLGLLVGSVFLSGSVSWWAVSYQGVSLENLILLILLLILLLPAYPSFVSVRRSKLIFSFFIVYLAINFFAKGVSSLFDPTVLFFALVMLPEPMTTPSRNNVQIFFGIFVALMFFVTSLLHFKYDPLILSLIAGNLVFFKLR